jgi:hypothetical protein
MSGWLRHIGLMLEARTGAGAGIVVWLLIAVVSLLAGLVCFGVAAFVFLANRFDGVTAGLILGGAFLLVAIIAVIAARLTRSHNMERAKRELALRRRASLLDPGFAPMAMEIGRALGWRRLAALAAVAVLAVGLGREWMGEREGKPGSGDKPAGD